jgi:hypothetical protein
MRSAAATPTPRAIQPQGVLLEEDSAVVVVGAVVGVVVCVAVVAGVLVVVGAGAVVVTMVVEASVIVSVVVSGPVVVSEVSVSCALPRATP